MPDVDLRSNRHPPKSASEKPTRTREESAEYQRPNSGVNFRYLNMRFTTCLWEVRGEAWYRAQRPTPNWMSGLVAVRYRSEPIMLLYSFWSTASPSVSSFSAVEVLMGVGMGLRSPKSNFLSMSLVYLAWWTKVPSRV